MKYKRVLLKLSGESLAGKQKDGFNAQSDRGVTVVLDIRLTPELIEEGNVREFISKIQNLRKDSGFAVTDRIRVFYAGSKEFDALVAKYADKICAATLCGGAGKLILRKATRDGVAVAVFEKEQVLEEIINCGLRSR